VLAAAIIGAVNLPDGEADLDVVMKKENYLCLSKTKLRSVG
jgi:hypothetical protein